MRGTIIVTVALFAAFCMSGTVESCYMMISDEKLVEQRGKEAAKEQDVPKVKSGLIIRKGE